MPWVRGSPATVSDASGRKSNSASRWHHPPSQYEDLADDKHLGEGRTLTQTYAALLALLLICAGIVASLLLTMASFWKVEPLAALLLVPYLLWGIFATVLTSAYMNLNPQARQSSCCAQRQSRKCPSLALTNANL